MHVKILTVDDSRAVRIIIKKAFNSYDCEIVEAANGVEGLAAASKENPDIILLDVTMPVMDGVEMLTKLKADPITKGIPVIMLTAEAGKENVLKIAKIGIRDYIIKPFKGEVLVEKVGRIVDIRPGSEVETKRKKLSDECEILVVEDKETIINQIREGLEHTSWKITGVNSAGEAINFTQFTIPDTIIISLSLPEEEAFSLFRMLRSNTKTKYVPIFGMAVKTAINEQKYAQQSGFTNIITKPINCNELETKISKAINLDTSERYFTLEEEFLVVRIPENVQNSTIIEIRGYLKAQISNSVNNGYNKVVFEVQSQKSVNMDIIKLMVEAMQICQDLTLTYLLVGDSKVSSECLGFEESKNWIFHESVEEAKNSLVKVAG